LAPGLVALSSAAILTVYAAGYLRTRSASERFAADGTQRRIAGPADATPVTVPAAPPSAAGVSNPSFARATPGDPALSAPLGDARVRPRRNPSRRPAEPPTSLRAPTPEELEALVPHAPVEPTTLPTADPTAIDSNLRTPEPPPPPPAASPAQYRDGTYSGWGTSRHGDIQATVVVEGGRIASAAITQCLTRYSCSWVSMLPAQVVSRQSANVDYVSGATQSASAFYYAVLEALSKAK